MGSLISLTAIAVLAALQGGRNETAPVAFDDGASEFEASAVLLEDELFQDNFADSGFAESDPTVLVPANDDQDSLPGTYLRIGWLPVGGSNGFGSTDIDASHTWLLGYDDLPPLNITPGAGIHFWSGPVDLDLPSRVYDAYLDLQWRPIESERWGLSVGVAPGWYGDFSKFDHRTFQLTGWLLGNYRVNSRWNLVGGIAYVRQLKDSILPIGGVIWTPNEDTRVELLIPKPKIARRVVATPSGSIWCYIAGELGGGTWAVADSANGNVSLTYTDLRLVLGVEAFRAQGLECAFEVGYVFARSISVDNFVVYEPVDSISIQATVAF
jgi:hypothetical protein